MPYDVDILLLGVQVIDQELRKRSDVRFGRQLGVWAIDLNFGVRISISCPSWSSKNSYARFTSFTVASNASADWLLLVPCISVLSHRVYISRFLRARCSHGR